MIVQLIGLVGPLVRGPSSLHVQMAYSSSVISGPSLHSSLQNAAVSFFW